MKKKAPSKSELTSRRSFLKVSGYGAALLLAGCTSWSMGKKPPAVTSPKGYAKPREKEIKMSEFYYEKKDLADFPNIGEWAPEQGKAFFDYYGKAMAPGKLDQKTKALIALTVATTQNCPYCIDSTTNQCLSLDATKEEMMEAVQVGALFMAGVTLAHSTQMRKIIKEKE